MLKCIGFYSWCKLVYKTVFPYLTKRVAVLYARRDHGVPWFDAAFDARRGPYVGGAVSLF